MTAATNPLLRFPGPEPSRACFFVFLYVPIVVLMALPSTPTSRRRSGPASARRWYGVVFDNDDLVRAKNSLHRRYHRDRQRRVIATLAALASEPARFRGQATASMP